MEGNLTPREREVLQTIAEGRPDINFIGEVTPTKPMQKLKLNSISELVRYAIRNGA